MITNIQLVNTFRGYAAERWGYVYGAQGQIWSAGLGAAWQKAGRSVPGGRDRKTYFTVDCARWIGHRVADCSGGIVQAIRQYDPKFTDRTANAFRNQFTEGGAIGTIPEIPGLAVWRSGHIGVYVGGGSAIEFRGTDYGCVEGSLKSRDFTHWGKIRGVDYGEAASPGGKAGEMSGETPESGAKRNVLVLGGSVYVRDKPDKSGDIVSIARRGELYELAGIAQSGWYEIGPGRYISDRRDLTKLV